MKNALYDHGYGIKWRDVYVEKRERYHSSVTDFHEHDFYEINLILSGNVKVLAANQAIDGTACKIVLTKPHTSHFISCKPDMLYSSLYLVFSERFIESGDVETMKLLSVFGENGNIYTLSPDQAAACAQIISAIGQEQNPFRKRLLVLYLLSYVDDFPKQYAACPHQIPAYVYEALTYINERFTEKIIAQEIADQLHVSRTALMMGFKKYTGKTIHEYVVYRRLNHAIGLLAAEKTEYEAALCSGFSGSSGLIQCFKRTLGMTPRQYLSQQDASQNH